MKKRVFFAVILTVIFILVFTIPALAAVYKYTGTSFWYLGDVFHEKEIDFTGGSIDFQVMGRGEVSGSHHTHTSTAEKVYGKIPQTILNLSVSFYGTTALDAAENELMRIISEIELGNRAAVQTGVEMNPGESGYIKQSVASSSGSDGDYLKFTNQFGNTGGTTKRILEVGNFVNERMSVVGSAEVWESTKQRSGNAKTGFWDTVD